ncbi:hypothetical protein [Thermus tengchongensis]|uniref:hypothetical protein n=1 Tax=Thermus tengchongensis TaxID=1214928 RepID=UPI001F377D92|nr:hypothetical protein [Thermus tengchongensis]
MRPPLVLLALIPPLLLLVRKPTLSLLLLLGFSFLLLWGGLGTRGALAALHALFAFFLGGEVLEGSPLRLPSWGLRFRWAVLLTLPWALGVFLLWLGLLEGVLGLALGGGALALLGFLPLRSSLERGLRAVGKEVREREAAGYGEGEEALLGHGRSPYLEHLRAALAGVDLEAPPARLRLAWSSRGVRLLSGGEEAPGGWREATFALDELLPGFDARFPQGFWDWDGVLEALGYPETPSWLDWDDPWGSLDRHDPTWRARLLRHPRWLALKEEALQAAKEALLWRLFSYLRGVADL